jgi:hypothetical protein
MEFYVQRGSFYNEMQVPIIQYKVGKNYLFNEISGRKLTDIHAENLMNWECSIG